MSSEELQDAYGTKTYDKDDKTKVQHPQPTLPWSDQDRASYMNYPFGD